MASKQKKIKIAIIVLWVLFLGAFISVPTIFYMVRVDAFGLFGGLPSLEDLEKPDSRLSSELFSADGVSLGKYYRDNRTPVSYDELSPELINTLLVTEDIRFKQHSGIDLRGLLRAFTGAITFSFKGGGSTITMQLAENLYRTNSENQGKLYSNYRIGQIITKLKEFVISAQLERMYTKEEILAMYLNTVEYGSNSHGIKVAAKTFFNKLPSQLNYKESATLIGSINAPTRYNPVYNPENAIAKRSELLYNLYKYEIINREQYDTLRVSDLGLNYKVDNQNQGLATYFRTVVKNYLVRWCKNNGYDLFDDGLKIYTTIDSRLQEYAEQAVAEHMDTLQQVFIGHLDGRKPWIDDEGRVMENFIETATKQLPYYRDLVDKFGVDSDSVDFYLNRKKKMTVFSWEGDVDTVMSTIDSLEYFKHFLHAGFMAMDPNNGHIKAWVGGIDHKYFKFDHVIQGRRQPGSTIKPIVYTAAIDNSYSPCFPVVDVAFTFRLPGQDPPTWTPDNSNGVFSGEKMTLRKAMANSVNSITAWLINELSPRTVVEYAQRLGITSPLDPVPSLALGGGGEVSVYEMVGAYSTFVNKGVHTKPYYISRIEDSNGNVIKQFVPQTREAINEETAYLMLHMLKGTTEEEGGTARGLEWSLKYGNDIGAKTGTTQNANDGWFIGVTKDLAAGAWVGGDEPPIHFRSWVLGQGARTALPIWERFMLKVYNDPALPYEKGPFDPPRVPLSVELDCSLYNNPNAQDSVQYDVVNEDEIF